MEASLVGSQTPLTISLVATPGPNLRGDLHNNFNNNNSSSNNNNNNNNNSSSPNLNHFSPSPSPNSSSPDPPKEGTSKCGAAAPNHFWNGVGYVVSWKIGCTSFEQQEAKEYCNSMGMEPVSLDTPAKQNEFNRLIAQDAQRFFWTGGI